MKANKTLTGALKDLILALALIVAIAGTGLVATHDAGADGGLGDPAIVMNSTSKTGGALTNGVAWTNTFDLNGINSTLQLTFKTTAAAGSTSNLFLIFSKSLNGTVWVTSHTSTFAANGVTQVSYMTNWANLGANKWRVIVTNEGINSLATNLTLTTRSL